MTKSPTNTNTPAHWGTGQTLAFIAGGISTIAISLTFYKTPQPARFVGATSAVVALVMASAKAEEILVITEEYQKEPEQYFNSSLGELTDTELYGANHPCNEEV